MPLTATAPHFSPLRDKFVKKKWERGKDFESCLSPMEEAPGFRLYFRREAGKGERVVTLAFRFLLLLAMAAGLAACCCMD